MTNTVTMSKDDAQNILDAFETDDWQKKLQAAITLRSILDKSSPETDVVVTTDESGSCVAVTRQDGEGRILSVIWEAAEQPSVQQEPAALLRKNYDGGHETLEVATAADWDTFPVYYRPQNLCCKSSQEPVAEVIESHVRPGLNGQYTAEVASPERLSVGAELFIHPQNLRCKSNQKRLATLWGYVKAEPLSEQHIAKAWFVAAGEHNASAVVKRRITRAIEKELGIEK